MEVTCSHCNKTLKISDEKLPRDQLVKIACPACKNKITIDTRGQGGGAPEPPADRPTADRSGADTPKDELDYGDDTSLGFYEEGTKLALILESDPARKEQIRAAVEARAGRDFFIVARTDALATSGMNEAITRVAAAREVGADASFVEAPNSIDELAEIGRRSPWPNVANMLEGGKTPVMESARLAEMGFQLILYPLAGLFSAARAMESVYQKLRDDGTTLGMEEQIMPFERFNDLIGVEQKCSMAERFEAE